jgi:nucleotide-binding universal stress UspA family protein
MLKSILAVTDFSPLANFAVDRAALLTRDHRASLHLLHVDSDFAWENLRTSLRTLPGNAQTGATRERLEAMARELSARYGLPAVDSAVVAGRAASQIVTRARTIGAGLIALGAHGGGIVQELALGGSAIKVLRDSPCPVLVVRREPQFPYETVLVATDFTATANRALAAARELSPKAAKALVNAYSVAQEGRMLIAGATDEDVERCRMEERETAQRKMDALMRDSRLDDAGELQGHVRHGHPASVLVEECEKLAADLLVVGKHGASALDERLLGSVTLNVLHHAPCDVLLVP